jgi:amino acid permease
LWLLIDLVLSTSRFSDKQREQSRVLVTASLLVLLTAIAMQLKNLGLVLSLSGSLIGSALIYIIPAVMNLSNIPKRRVASQQQASLAEKLELLLNYGIIAMGVAVAVIGVKTTLQGAGH